MFYSTHPTLWNLEASPKGFRVEIIQGITNTRYVETIYATKAWEWIAAESANQDLVSVKGGVQGKGSCVGHNAAESGDQDGGHDTERGAATSADTATYTTDFNIELVLFSSYYADWWTLDAFGVNQEVYMAEACP